LTQLLATIDLVRDHLNPRLAIDGVVLTMADARTNLSADVEAEARRHLDGTVYETVIPRSVRLSEAPSHGRSIATYAPDSRGGTAYLALAAEFRARNARYVSRAPGEHPLGVPVVREPDVAVLS
jgi:chromosome partitioning protein